MSFDNAESGSNTELDQKELILALSILKIQCDYTLDGIFNKKLKEIDNNLLNVGSKRQTINILSDLLVQLPLVINTIKDIEFLDSQEKTKKLTVEENEKANNEMIEEGEIIENNDQENAESNAQKLDLPIDHTPVCQLSQRKATEKSKKTLKNNSILENQQLKRPKSENFIYSSSEQSEEESEEEQKIGEVQQQSSSSSSYKNRVPKLEQVVEETTEVIPELREMSIDEIEKIAAENAKRNKRIRYFSTDSEDENNNKKKRKKRNNIQSKNKSQNKKDVKNNEKRGRPPKPKQITSQENEKTVPKNNQESITDQAKSVDTIQSKDTQSKDPHIEQDSLQIEQQSAQNQSTNSDKIAGGLVQSMSNKENNEINKKCVNEMSKSTCTINSIKNSVQVNNVQIIASKDKTQLNHHHASTSSLKPRWKKSIFHVLNINSTNTVKKIDVDQILIDKNLKDEMLVDNLKNAKILMQIKLDRFLISIVEMYWKFREERVNGNIYNNREITQRVDWYLKYSKISNSIHLRNALVPIFDQAFGNEIPYADFIFQELIYYTVREDGVPRVLGSNCERTVGILNRMGFLKIVKNMTSNRMKFLEFVKKEIESNYEIDFWISD